MGENNVGKWWARLGGKKAVWCFVALALAYIAMGMGWTSESIWLTSLITLSGMYIGGNLGTKVIHAWARNPLNGK